MQHRWLHILSSTAGTCVLCLKYNPNSRTRDFVADLKGLDAHAASKHHKASKALYDRDQRWLAQLARVGGLETRVEELESQVATAVGAQRVLQDAEHRALLACLPFDRRDTLEPASELARSAGQALAAGRAELVAAQAVCDPEMAIVYPVAAEHLDNCLAGAAAKAATVKRFLGGNVDVLGICTADNDIQAILQSLDKLPPSQRGKFNAAARCCFTCLGILKRGRPMLEYEGAMETAISLGDVPADSLYCNDNFGWRFAEVANLVLVQVHFPAIAQSQTRSQTRSLQSLDKLLLGRPSIAYGCVFARPCFHKLTCTARCSV